jgi:CRISPR-associated protein Cas5d
MSKPFGVMIRVWGEFALFSRPEMKVERVSYDVITPSAARGIVEAIYWKPEIRWVVDRLRVLSPIRTTTMRRNEVASKIPANSASSAMKAGRGSLGLVVEEDRQQRAAIMLRDVDYLIGAHFEIVSGEANPAKHLDQFSRRARSGQCFQRPYLGTRECPCEFELIEGTPPDTRLGETERDRDLGYMLHDIAYIPDKHGTIIESSAGRRLTAEPRFFHARMRDGWIEVPPLNGSEVRS